MEHLPSGWVLPLRRLRPLACDRLLVPGLVPGFLAVPEALLVPRRSSLWSPGVAVVVTPPP